MVYYGPSQGCETCKRRRKKCDGNRPSCLRCQQANRACGGYTDHSNPRFRNYDGRDRRPKNFQSIARKCTLPVQTGPEDVLPKEVSYAEAQTLALRSFFYDYCIQSENSHLSRGFLSNLEIMVRRQSWDSNLAKICRAVAWASYGVRLSRPSLVRQGQTLHDEALGHFARDMADPENAYSSDVLATSMLLGLYEIIVASNSRSFFVADHARGVTAILHAENSSLGLLQVVKRSRTDSPTRSKGLIRVHGLFSNPSSSKLHHDLDGLLISFGYLWKRANHLIVEQHPSLVQIHLLKQDAVRLNQRLVSWQDVQLDSFKPRIVGHIPKSQPGTNTVVGRWPGKVDTYFDLYVVGVWNISRVSRCLLISLILKLSKIAEDGIDHSSEHQEMMHLVDDVIASIPYHLTEDVHAFLGNEGNTAEITNPGKMIGGLFIMQPLYVLLNLTAVPQHTRDYLKESLKWIGKHMGIGMASLYAQDTGNHEQSFANACTILMTGLLV